MACTSLSPNGMRGESNGLDRKGAKHSMQTQQHQAATMRLYIGAQQRWSAGATPSAAKKAAPVTCCRLKAAVSKLSDWVCLGSRLAASSLRPFLAPLRSLLHHCLGCCFGCSPAALCLRESSADSLAGVQGCGCHSESSSLVDRNLQQDPASFRVQRARL